MRNWLQRGLAALGLAALASCTTVPQPAASGKPALWQVADQDTTIYLFGTIHMLPANSSWRTSAFDQAVARSQGLFVETIVDEANPAQLAGELARLGIANGLPPIAQRVPPEKRALLETAIAKTGVPRPLFDRMETWAAAFTLLGVQFKALGLQGQHGVESVLRGSFAGAGKPVGQLETNSEQLGFFDALPQNAQLALLEGAIEAPQAMRVQFDAMIAAWLRGDVDAIARTFNEDLAESPELMDALIRRRNANWSGWIERRMALPGTVMVAVGAGHLAGDSSVQRQLEQRGLKVTRIQ